MVATAEASGWDGAVCAVWKYYPAVAARPAVADARRRRRRREV